MGLETVDAALSRVIYTSVARNDLVASDVDDILRTARNHNADHSITGVLVYADGMFVQVLEGPKIEIDSLMDSIKRDHRHSNVIVQFVDILAEREFADWAMAYVGPDEAIAKVDGVRSLAEIVRTINDREGVAATFVEALRTQAPPKMSASL